MSCVVFLKERGEMQEMRKNVVILLVFSFHGNQGELRLDWPLGRNCYQLILLHQPLMSFFVAICFA